MRVLDLESRVFGNDRSLRIWLPPGYDDDLESSYPVLYLNDGQNLFDARTSLHGRGEWRVDETLADLLGRGAIDPLVVVGIDNTGRRGRAREYLPYPDDFLDPPEPDPQGERYADFLADEVLPFIENRFRVSTRREDRALGGSSHGALVSLHVAITRPELFSRLLLESPSFYVDERHVLRDAGRAPLDLDRVYLGVGTNELALPDCPLHDPGNREAVGGALALARLLERRGFVHGETLRVFVEPCAEHRAAAWARRLPTALEFLFGN